MKNFFRKASHEGNWEEGQRLLPYAVFKGDEVEIKNIRNFTYRSESDYEVRYYDKTYDLRKLKTVDYIVVPFRKVAAAHPFLSFGFEGGEYLAISIESRRGAGEPFSPFKGLFRQYEMIYVIADERDVIQLRAIHRKRNVYLYPVQATPEKVRELFVDMLERANSIKEKPEFYNTLFNSCSTNIVRHVNKISPKRIPWDYRIIMPKNSDVFARKLGLIGGDLSLVEARQRYMISDAARKYADDPDFSVKIREELGIL